MWNYDKKLQYPVNIKNPNPRLAKFIISQYGGADGNCLSMGKTVTIYSEKTSKNQPLERFTKHRSSEIMFLKTCLRTFDI